MFDILLIEDNPGDIRLTQEALKEGEVPHCLHLATDGETALKYLLRETPHENAVRPDLILLDWNLPKINGKEVLKKIKSNPELRQIPVLVLTTSNAETDIQQAYHHHANCFITKPTDFEQFLEVIHSIKRFWLHTVNLPTRE